MPTKYLSTATGSKY